MKLTLRTVPQFYWSQFLTGFCCRLLLPIALLLLLGLVAGRVGGPYGAFYLVWNENLLKQGVVGFAVLMLCCEVLFVGYLLQTRFTLPTDRYRTKRVGPEVTYPAGVFVSLLLTVAVVAGGLRLVDALTTSNGADTTLTDPFPPKGWHPPFWALPFAAGALLAVVLSVLAVSVPYSWARLRAFHEGLGGFVFNQFDRFPILEVRRPEKDDLFLHGVAFVSVAFAAVFFTVVAVVPVWFFSPIVGVCFLLHVVVAVYAFLAYFLPRLLPVVLLLLFGLLLLGGIPVYKQRFPGLEPFYDAPAELSKYDPRSSTPHLLLPEKVQFCSQALGRHPAGKKRPLVVVCASGGGIRSAAWTFAVLQRLEEEFGKQKEPVLFPYHVRMITGASGGMLGASAYTLGLPAPGKERDVDPQTQFDRLTMDGLSPVVHRMVYGDLLGLFLPSPRHFDRGRALEQAWSENMDGLLDRPFGELKEEERAGWRPSLAFSPMLIEDGRRLLVSNLDLRGVVRNNGNLLDDPNKESLFSNEALELFRLFPEAQGRFCVGTAVRMSASFPYFSPAVPLPTRPRRRVVDAGYYDDYGVSLAAAWLFSGRSRAWLRDNASAIVLVQIRDGLDEEERRFEKPVPDASGPLSRGLEWLTSPPEGLYNSRLSSSAFRNDEQLEVLSRLLSDEMQTGPLLRKLTEEQVKWLYQADKGGTWLLPGSRDLTASWRKQFGEMLDKDPKTTAKAGELLKEVVRAFDRSEGIPFFTTVTFEFGGRASLSWYLTDDERKEIRRKAREDDRINDRVRRLVQWWDRQPRDLDTGTSPALDP